MTTANSVLLPAIQILVLLSLGLTGARAVPNPPPDGLLTRPLSQRVNTVEGPVSQPAAMENSPFCRLYLCALTDPAPGETGDSIWVVVPRKSDVGKVMQQRSRGTFFPEVTVHTDRNSVTFVNLALDTMVRASMPAATLNLLGNFTRLVLGTPISAQKFTACYRRLAQDATCVVGTGSVRVGGTLHTYTASFRTVDDGQGYSVVNYAIGLED